MGGNGEGIVVVIVKQTAFKIGKVGGKLYTQECPLFITGFITCETKQNSSPSGCNFRLSRYLLSASITPPSCGLNWIATLPDKILDNLQKLPICYFHDKSCGKEEQVGREEKEDESLFLLESCFFMRYNIALVAY